jgi:hypothetical protein
MDRLRELILESESFLYEMDSGMRTGYRISKIRFFDDDEDDETSFKPRTVWGNSLDEAFKAAIQTCIDEMNMSYGHLPDPEDDPTYQELTKVFGRSKEEVEAERQRRRDEPPIGTGDYAWYNDPDNWRLYPEGGFDFLLIAGPGDEAWHCTVERFVNGKRAPISADEIEYYVVRDTD